MSESKANKDDEMSPEERLAWLRERGVLVETPEERRNKAISQIIQESDETDDVITYVLVPCDTSKPLQELSFPVSKTVAGGDALAEHLKTAFAGDGKDVDLSLFQQQKTQLGSADAKVSEDALKQVAMEGNVETFTLANPTPSNHFTQINVYLDEVGMLKRLPLNTRATDYARRAGFNPPPTFYGDVFLGRVKARPILNNVSFRLGEDTSLDAPWLQRATVENLEHQAALNRITGRSDVQQSADGEDGVAKEEVGYSWTQTEEELELVVPLPKGASAKDVKVKFLPQTIKVSCQNEPVISLSLFEHIDPDGCTWTLDRDGQEIKLVITMEKVEPASWPRVVD